MIPTFAVWAAATSLHFVLTDRAAARLARNRANLDERVFVSASAGVASLSIVLHAVAVTAGLSLMTGALGLALWHVGLWWFGRRSTIATHTAQRATALELLALGIFTAIVLSWIGLAARSDDILGPDAAHYHVPYAVNFAAGASPFSLPATPHVYPMAGSLISAWFIIPLGHPQIVDLALVLPFVLIAASITVIFRSTTGLSGMAWASWVTLALFSTPMFRLTSLGSADLWFAAGFVSLVAVILVAWSRGAWAGLDLILAAGSAGLLVGSKTTGVPALALIVAVAALLAVARRLVSGRWLARPDRAAGVIAAAAAVFLGAGGVWLLRSWIQFGSPIAPSGLTIAGITIFDGETFQRSTYLSVLAEMETSSFHLWPRTKFFLAQWFGPWFLPALWPIAFLAADLVVRARRPSLDDRWWARCGLLLITVVTGASLVWMLMGAPWTGLERSRGLTLRYVLPIAALLPLAAFVGCFPIGVAWYRRTSLPLVVGTAIVVGAVLVFRTSLGADAQTVRALPVPGIGPLWLVVAVVWVWLIRASTWPRASLARMGSALVLAGVILWWTPVIVRHTDEARSRAAERLAAEEIAPAPDPATPGVPWRQTFLAVRAAERAAGQPCAARRFFSLVRFDEPLALQPPEFSSQVYYAARDVEAARRAGPISTCDYIISSTAMAGTDKGAALTAALAGGAPVRPFASTRDSVILTVHGGG